MAIAAASPLGLLLLLPFPQSAPKVLRPDEHPDVLAVIRSLMEAVAAAAAEERDSLGPENAELLS